MADTSLNISGSESLISVDPSTLVCEEPDFTDDPTFDARVAEQQLKEQNNYTSRPRPDQKLRTLVQSAGTQQRSYGDYFPLVLEGAMLPLALLAVFLGCESEEECDPKPAPDPDHAEVGHGEESKKTGHLPAVLTLSGTTPTNDEIKAAIKKALNDNLDFEKLVMGGGLREDDDGNFIRPANGVLARQDIDTIERMLKSGRTPEQLRALSDYREMVDDPWAYFSGEMAQDVCGQPLTTAAITPGTLQHTYRRGIGPDAYMETPEWPALCGTDYQNPAHQSCEAAKPEQGIFDVQVNLKDNGFVDVHITLDGKTDPNGRKFPAFWGSFIAYNLVKGGSTGAIEDPTTPLMMNIGRMEIDLHNVYRVLKVQKNGEGKVDMSCENPQTHQATPCPCPDDADETQCTNIVLAYQDRPKDSDVAVRIEPYENCWDYFQKKFPGFDHSIPFGCFCDGDSFPFLIDITTSQGGALYLSADHGRNTALLTLTKNKLERNLKNFLVCPSF